MRLLVVAVTFGVTIGGLFLFENYKTAPKEENYAQIVQNLQNQSPTRTPTPKSTTNKIPVKAPINSPAPSFMVTPTITPLPASPTSSPTPTPLEPTATDSSLPLMGQAPSPSPTPTPTPTPQSSQQNEQLTVVSLTSPVKQNSTAQLDIKTTPEAQCAIKVTLPSGSQSTAKGLEDKTADNSGSITWSWKINWNTTPGTANIDVICSKNGQSFSKSLQMEIIER